MATVTAASAPPGEGTGPGSAWLPHSGSAAALAAAAAAGGGAVGEEEIDGAWHEMVLLPREILRESPSRQLGVPAEEELRHRIFGCELIQEAGILLRQPQVVMATAQNLVHRFFYRRALTSADARQEGKEEDGANRKRVFLFDAFTVAMGCLFLASKLEELPKAPRDLIFVFHSMLRRRRGLPPSLLEVTSGRYHDLREALLTMEKYILKELGFGFYNIMDHPHKFILYYIKTLGGDSALAQRAWNYLNDSLRLDCCVRYRAELIACAAIFMAARDLQVKLPDNPPWWDLFGARLQDMKRVCNAILGLYHQEPVAWLEPLHPRSLVSAATLDEVERPPPAPSPSPRAAAAGEAEGANGGKAKGNGKQANGDAAAAAADDQMPTPIDNKGDRGRRSRSVSSSASSSRDRRRRRSPSPRRSRDGGRRRRRRSGSRSASRSRSRDRRRYKKHRSRSRSRDRGRYSGSSGGGGEGGGRRFSGGPDRRRDRRR